MVLGGHQRLLQVHQHAAEEVRGLWVPLDGELRPEDALGEGEGRVIEVVVALGLLHLPRGALALDEQHGIEVEPVFGGAGGRRRWQVLRELQRPLRQVGHELRLRGLGGWAQDQQQGGEKGQG